jgi:hypothetical protein
MRGRTLHVALVNAAVCLALLVAAAPAAANPAYEEDVFSDDPRPFNGVFSGIAFGDRGTQAPLSLDLSQQGPDVAATATLGEGLYVATRFCGGATVPAGTVDGTGHVDLDAPGRVWTSASFDVQGFPVRMAIQGDLSEDGQALAAEATLDLPSFCGTDPVLTGTLLRVD